jgi:uncharacterized membrane protein
MNRYARIFRHLTTGQSSGKKAFPLETLQAIQTTIAEGEALHRAEVRLIVEPSLDLNAAWTGMTSRERAGELFTEYRIWDTEENCGVLIYINLADHQVEIIADRGIARCVPSSGWQAVCRTMTSGFAQQIYHDSTIAGLKQLNALLREHFPDSASQQNDQNNQLPNQPILL